VSSWLFPIPYLVKHFLTVFVPTFSNIEKGIWGRDEKPIGSTLGLDMVG
jgi:hypothetical protein